MAQYIVDPGFAAIQWRGLFFQGSASIPLRGRGRAARHARLAALAELPTLGIPLIDYPLS